MSRARRWALPILVLIVGLIGTLAAAISLARADEARQSSRFHRLGDNAIGAIEARMLSQITLLRGTAGFFDASDEVSRQEFHDFVTRLKLVRNYPGVLGVGYAAYSPDREGLARIAAQARQSGAPDFRPWPNGARPEYSTIVYLQPLSRMNREALGFDMLSEATRRAAMLESARTGTSRTSGRVRLVQEIESVKQPGFLIYTPLYERGGPMGPGGRLRGWVYSPLRAYDLFGAIFAHDLNGIVVEVYDAAVGPGHLLYRSGTPAASPVRSLSRRLEIAGRPWIVRITPAPSAQENSPYQTAAIVGVAGALVTLLIAVLLLQQTQAAARTEQEVASRTAELRSANAQLLAEAEAREAAESQVRQMQKMEAIGQLTGGIAHDFNNMLAVIVGNLDLAERRLDDPGRVARAIANARLGATKAAELTQRLLAFGRQQALAPRALDANALVAGMTELLRRALGEAIHLETRLADGLWTIHADPTQLENAILNIAINARDAMPRGGTLTISTENVPGAEGGPPGDSVLIAIADTGEGMTSEIAARAIEPFFTTKEVGKGTGLGLSQVYGFVRQSGGHLDLDSAEGQGTTVRLYLPRCSASVRGTSRASPGETPTPSGTPAELVLVVEDDPRVREMSVETLRDLNYSVIAAPDGTSALAELERHPDVKLLFTDVVMPGMNGRELADEARARRPDLKIVFTTGYSRNALPREDRPGRGVSLLQKPFSASQLARKVREELDA